MNVMALYLMIMAVGVGMGAGIAGELCAEPIRRRREDKKKLEKLEKYLARPNVTIVKSARPPNFPVVFESYSVFRTGTGCLDGDFTIARIHEDVYNLGLDWQYDTIPVETQSQWLKKRIFESVKRAYPAKKRN